ncbi:MAG: hypothetical protein ACKVQT_27780 [Burkholderiales bacterium]
MTSILIKDLAISKDLNSEDLAAVRGGSNVAFLVGPTQVAQNGGGFNFGSPNVQVAPQTVTQSDTTVSIASVVASMNTGIAQTKLF